MSALLVCLWLSTAAIQVAAADPLVDAARAGDTATVRQLLARGVAADGRHADGSTALHWMVHRDELVTTRLLLKRGADANAVNAYGVTTLSLACTNGSDRMVKLLLGFSADADAVLPSGETALMRCSRSGNVQAVRALLARGAPVNVALPENGQTALMWAVAQGHAEVARALLKAGADVNAVSTGGFSALQFAARVGDARSAVVLIDAGADVNEVGPLGRTPLLLASVSGQEHAALQLLQKGADPKASDDFGATALHYTVLRGGAALNGLSLSNHVVHLFRPSLQRLARALLERGADPDARLTRPMPVGGGGSRATVGATSFLLAAAAPDVDVMRLLADHGADTKSSTHSGLTPLMAAAGLGRGQDFDEQEQHIALAAVRFAIERGGNVSASDEDGLTALHGAAANGAEPIVRLLAEHGAHLDARDKYQQTPLSIATGELLPWVPKGDELGEVVRPGTRDLLLALGATPLDAPGYFQPPAEESESYRINSSQRLR